MLFIAAATVLASLLRVILAQDLRINTLTNPVQCEPVQFTWSGGVPSYYLSLLPGGQATAAALKQFPAQNGNSMTWTVNLPSGTSFSNSLRDSTGALAYSDSQTVQPGPDSSCLNVSSTVSPASSTNSMSTSSAASTNTATATSPIAAGASQRGTSTTSSASGSSGSVSGTAVKAVSSSIASSTGAAPTSSNAASMHASAGAIGIAGLLGLAGAALLG